MAEGYEPYPRRDSKIGTLTNTWPTSTSFDGSIRKSYGVVNMSFRIIDTNHASTAHGKQLVSIPEGYRPGLNMPMLVFIKFHNIDIWAPATVWVNTDGSVNLNYSSTYYLSEIWGVATYPLA